MWAVLGLGAIAGGMGVAMASVTVQLNGIEAAIAVVDEFQERITDMRPVAQNIFATIQADVDSRFDASPPTESGGTVRGGEFWDALSEPYLQANPRRYGGQILRDTGELLQSFGVGAPFNSAIARPDEIIFGSSLPKARGLQEKRPMIFIHPQLIAEIEQTVIGYLNQVKS